VRYHARSAGLLAIFSRRQLGAITGTYARALDGERSVRTTLEDEAWTREGLAALSGSVQGELSVAEVASNAVATLAKYVGAEVGALFVAEGPTLHRRAGYALDPRAGGAETFGHGEGLVGKAAESHEVLRVRAAKLTDEERLMVRAGSGERMPAELLLASLRAGGKSVGVLELGFHEAPDERVLDLVSRIGDVVAIALRSAEYRTRLRELLEESQRQAEELQTQQEELRVVNGELEEQSNEVNAAGVRLEERQEELTLANARLEEQATELEAAQELAVRKPDDLERASRYKSEFLANMSHELRTPLNSTLILAKLLADNKDGNLSPEQVKFASSIHGASNDLLALINDILDLSKIEAGKTEIHPSEVHVERIASGLLRTFEPVATQRALRLSIVVAPETPASLTTDGQRLDQILRNLLSYALKFTDNGEVELTISPGPAKGTVLFAVRDTGIGIAPYQHELIFEAFRQADGTSNRKYGGTGLGLSISRDLARLLGGDISLTSHVGRGSTFTLTLPVTPASANDERAAVRFEARSPAPSAPPMRLSTRSAQTAPRPQQQRLVEDDRDSLDKRRRVVLVIEDDPRFAQIIVDLAHERDFQCVVAGNADDGVALANEVVPTAIVLDVNLPGHSGLSVLDRLKRTAETRHIPVHVVTVTDHSRAALSMGAAASCRSRSSASSCLRRSRASRSASRTGCAASSSSTATPPSAKP
jgi:signal transduction histidine kinase